MKTIPINARILRHKPPFLFISSFSSKEKYQAEALIDPIPKKYQWLMDHTLSAICIEFSAQLFGARYRLEGGDTAKSGYISKVDEFKWVGSPSHIQRLTVMLREKRGDFYDFSATYFDVDDNECAYLCATLYISYEKESKHDVLDLNYDAEELSDGESLCKVLPSEFPTSSTIVKLNKKCSVYKGHFPGNPITPGVLLLDVMSYFSIQQIDPNQIFEWELNSVWNVVFHTVTFPNDILEIKSKVLEDQLNFTTFSVSLFKGKKRCVRAKMKF
ncbi:hypothetical protein [Marinomonas sp. 2405UD68-3]|uniref:hypothetical protein n=1 Tax=Marinomonas sp. 2405UD68-3 TaxID=3391835 RepID=UPI0039C9D394